MNMKMEGINEHLKRRYPNHLLEAGGIRRKKKKTRFYIDNEFLEKGYAAMYRNISLIDVYAVLARHANYRSQIAFPSIEKIIEQSGQKNRNYIVKAIDILEALNIIKVARSKGRKSNQYLLLDSSLWKKPDSITLDTVNRIKKRK